MAWFGLLCLLKIHDFSTQISGNFPELFEGGFEIFDHFLGTSGSGRLSDS
jgi:hypothetical protein